MPSHLHRTAQPTAANLLHAMSGESEEAHAVVLDGAHNSQGLWQHQLIRAGGVEVLHAPKHTPWKACSVYPSTGRVGEGGTDCSPRTRAKALSPSPTSTLPRWRGRRFERDACGSSPGSGARAHPTHHHRVKGGKPHTCGGEGRVGTEGAGCNHHRLAPLSKTWKAKREDSPASVG